MSSKPVVVGVDGSEGSLRAAEWAAGEAARRKLALRIVSAPAPLPRMPSPYVRESTIADALRDAASQHLSLAAERAGEVTQGLAIETGLLSGPPGIALEGCGPDASMLVLGARGAGGFGTMTLGSVSRHAAAHASCPVVVGIRDPEDAQEALALAFEEAALRGAELLVVHAWLWIPPGLHGRAGIAFDPEMISAAASGQLDDLLSAWREKYPAVPVSPKVLHGHPARILAGLSARADLTVLGKHSAPSLGSIWSVVLGHAHGPVAIVPSEPS